MTMGVFGFVTFDNVEYTAAPDSTLANGYVKQMN